MNPNAARAESLFRQFTPLFLLGLLVMVLLEPVLPYGDWLRHHLGEDVFLKTAVVFLILYTLLLWGESLRLHGLLTGLLEAFKTFDRDRAGEAAGAASPKGKGSNNPKARLEAAKLLVAAMRSTDPEIVATSHHNLVRLVGQDLGADPDAWQRWLSSQES
ncbi:MAG: hypothetical protein KAI24_17340 [Planctomycetes bacterium]|nr:hypothetical protein [Planctomycetota bacterium]